MRSYRSASELEAGSCTGLSTATSLESADTACGEALGPADVSPAGLPAELSVATAASAAGSAPPASPDALANGPSSADRPRERRAKSRCACSKGVTCRGDARLAGSATVIAWGCSPSSLQRMRGCTPRCRSALRRVRNPFSGFSLENAHSFSSGPFLRAVLARLPTQLCLCGRVSLPHAADADSCCRERRRRALQQ